jgi:hypothetical protein
MPIGKAAMQFVVRELFPEPKKGSRIRNGLLSKEKSLVIYSKMRQGALFVDGNKIEIPLNYGDKVEISPNGKPLRAIL